MQVSSLSNSQLKCVNCLNARWWPPKMVCELCLIRKSELPAMAVAIAAERRWGGEGVPGRRGSYAAKPHLCCCNIIPLCSSPRSHPRTHGESVAVGKTKANQFTMQHAATASCLGGRKVFIISDCVCSKSFAIVCYCCCCCCCSDRFFAPQVAMQLANEMTKSRRQRIVPI